MNPFLNKPLKKVQGQGPPQLKNSSQEHRPSKYMNPPKNAKASNAEKKAMNEIQKIRNQSPRDKNAKSNNINIINRFKEEETNPKTERDNESGLNNIKEEKQANQIKQENTNTKIFANNKKNNINSNLKVVTNINFLIPFDSAKLHFNNNDEVLEYLKNKIKEGSIKNVIQKLELKKNDFTGFTLSKKNLGYTIYEIEMEDDIEKINETIKKQRVEIKNKPIEIRYIGAAGPLKKDKDNVVEEKKNVTNVTKNNDSLIQAMKKKTLERIEKNDAKNNEKVNNEIKNLQNKIGKQKEELKNAENEKDFMFKNANAKNQNKSDSSSVDNRRQSGVKKGELKYCHTKKEEEVVPDVIKKKISAEESQRKMSRAYVRFKKAFGNQKEDEKAGEKDRKPPEKSEKIASIAEILKEHIIKPLAEIQEENDLTKPRAGSVGIRQIKIDRGGGERKEEGVAQILQNIPVQKKNVKKPKMAAFIQ